MNKNAVRKRRRGSRRCREEAQRNAFHGKGSDAPATRGRWTRTRERERERRERGEREGLGRTCNPWSVDQNPTCLKPPVHLPPRCEEFSTCEGERERGEREERGVDPSKVQIRA